MLLLKHFQQPPGLQFALAYRQPCPPLFLVVVEQRVQLALDGAALCLGVVGSLRRVLIGRGS